MTEKKISKVQILTECAVMVAVSVALFLVSDLIPSPFVYGGSITPFAQVPIVIVSYRHGIKKGLLSGLVLSIIQLMFGFANFGYVNSLGAYAVVALADYLVPFTCLGLGGMFKGRLKGKQAFELGLGALVVSFIRFLCHFISGVTVWIEYAPEELGVWLYSLVYNGSYMLAEAVITVVGVIGISAIFNLNKKRLG